MRTEQNPGQHALYRTEAAGQVRPPRIDREVRRSVCSDANRAPESGKFFRLPELRSPNFAPRTLI